jgi:periplasmic divalent cation tolerance protein
MTEARIVLSTTGSREEAQKIARALVERELAACVNIVGPIESVYRWQGKMEDAPEFLLIVKTTTAAFPAVRDAIRELHSYDLPECILLNVEDGGKDYLDWVTTNVKSR